MTVHFCVAYRPGALSHRIACDAESGQVAHFYGKVTCEDCKDTDEYKSAARAARQQAAAEWERRTERREL